VSADADIAGAAAIRATDTTSTAIYALSAQGLALARRLAVSLHADVYAPARLAAGEPRVSAFASLGPLVAETFARYPRHVFVGATGIAVRAIAPHLANKTTDPAVAALDLAARFAVSLVSGHAGGANELARELARLTGATPVITTGTDVSGLPGVDELASARGMAVTNAQAVKGVSAALLEGRAVQLYDPEARLLDPDAADGLLVPTAPEAWDPDSPGVWCHWRTGGEHAQTFRAYPRCLCLGLGCRKGVEKEEILAHVERVLAQHGLARQSISAVGTADIKRDDPGLCAAAAALGPEVVFYEPQALARVEAAGQSETVKRRTGTGSVCEAAALLLSGAEEPLVPKVKSTSVTCAVALKPAHGREKR
jgi:cobalamin biosynthesis protein CbiG